MITAHPESYVYRLLELLAVVGEFPTNSLSILGDERTIKALVHRCESEQRIRMVAGGKAYTIKLFNISGHGKARTLRLSKDALVLLSEMHPTALSEYMEAFRNHHFTGNEFNIDRNHRIGETVAVCKQAGAEIRPYMLPALQTQTQAVVIGNRLACFISRSIKQFAANDMNKVGFSRSTGLLFSPDRPFVLYNARAATMKWSGSGEYKAYRHLLEVVIKNSAETELNSAILFARNGMNAIETLLETRKPNRTDLPFSSIYPSIHYVPLDRTGVRLLKLLTKSNMRERLLSALLPDTIRVAEGRYLSCDCDAASNGHYILSHLDGDIARLVNYRDASLSMPEGTSFEVICFPWQLAYVHEYVGDTMKLTAIPMEVIEREIV